MIGLFRDRRALDQVVGQLLVLMVSLSAISFVLVVIGPLLAQYNSRNRITEAEAIMTSLYNEIVKVQEEPAGSRRRIEIDIKRGGIELLNDPPRMVYYVQVPKRVAADVVGMEFAYTARGAMFRLNLTIPLVRKTFIGPGSNLVYISKTEDGRIHVNQLPSVTINSTKDIGTAVQINWTAFDPDADPLSLSLYCSDNSGASWNQICSSTAIAPYNSSYTYGWSYATVPGGKYIIKVVAVDTGDLRASDTSDPIFIP